MGPSRKWKPSSLEGDIGPDRRWDLPYTRTLTEYLNQRTVKFRKWSHRLKLHVCISSHGTTLRAWNKEFCDNLHFEHSRSKISYSFRTPLVSVYLDECLQSTWDQVVWTRAVVCLDIPFEYIGNLFMYICNEWMKYYYFSTRSYSYFLIIVCIREYHYFLLISWISS